MTASATLRDTLLFMARSLRSPWRVASLVPSSASLARAMLAGIVLRPGDVVVELGSGTGAVTSALAAACVGVADVRCLLIERDPRFCDLLRQRYPDMIVHQAHVDDLAPVLRQYGLPPARLILGELPYAAMPEQQQRAVLAGALAALRDDGEFRLFNFAGRHWLPGARRVQRILAEMSPRVVRGAVVWRNLPPAIVLTAAAPSASAGQRGAARRVGVLVARA